jgi:hypothetical protein
MDPFGELDEKMMTDMLRPKRDAFLALLAKPRKSEFDLATIREARKDKFLDAVAIFKDYYELLNMSGRTDAQERQIATVQAKYPSIARVYANAKLKAMLMPEELYAQMKSQGIGSRSDAMLLATMKEQLGRSRRRRKLTRRRRITRKRK